MVGLRKRPPASENVSKLRKKHKEEIRKLLLKSRESLTHEDLRRLESEEETVKTIERSDRQRDLKLMRQEYVIDDDEVLLWKVTRLAGMMRSSSCCVFYTGAGISTACGLPDFRSQDFGAWNRPDLVKSYLAGAEVSPFAEMKPTFSHMALSALVSEDLVKHVVSQNCDGLHLRSGIPPGKLSEIHGNMFAEACVECYPQKLFYRSFDVTEDTGFRKHSTKRVCLTCGYHLKDTVVHRDEYNTTDYPQNWVQADPLAKEADLIVAVGSRMDIIKCYKRLWRSASVEKKRLVIINMGWTTKDKVCNIKLNGACDKILTMLCQQLSIVPQEYTTEDDLLKTYMSKDYKTSDEVLEKHQTPDIFDENQVKNSQGYIPGWMRVILNHCPKKPALKQKIMTSVN